MAFHRVFSQLQSQTQPVAHSVGKFRLRVARASPLFAFVLLLQSPSLRDRALFGHAFETPPLLSSFLRKPTAPPPEGSDLLPIPPSWLPRYQPPTETVPADPSNFDTREDFDINGNPARFERLVVLHETVGSADSALALFQNYNPNDADQVSYHSIIRRDGTVVYVVPEEMRAFGAGNSEFVTSTGVVETVQTNPDIASSVNNFAYHVSLESPPDGFDYSLTHSGYTELQYQSLAWLIAGLRVSEQRITTHQIVDRGGERSDPRSFDFERFRRLLRAYSGQTLIGRSPTTSAE